MRKEIFVIMVLTMILTACDTSQQDKCTGAGALFQDDFSGEQDCGWAIYSRGGATTDISEGALRISTSQPGQSWWTNHNREFDDVSVNGSARHGAGAKGND